MMVILDGGLAKLRHDMNEIAPTHTTPLRQETLSNNNRQGVNVVDRARHTARRVPHEELASCVTGFSPQHVGRRAFVPQELAVSARRCGAA